MSCWGWQLSLSGMRDWFGIFGAVIRIRKLSLLLVMTLRMSYSIQTTPRIRVWSDRIPRVLLFIYVCRGLSGNMEERPTRHVYIEILTCAPIFLGLEGSRSHTNEREAERAHRQGARPTPWVPAHLWWPIRVHHADYAPPHLRIKENRSVKVGLIRRPRFIWEGYISKAPGPWRNQSSLFITIFFREDSEREVPLGFQPHRA